MNDDLKNYGLLEQKEAFAKDWHVGGISGAVKTVLREDGNFEDFLPVVEYQKGSVDTMACVTFSALNCLETVARLNGFTWNKSDRFTAKMSGTGKNGNYLRNVAESIRVQGVLDEDVWPYMPRTMTWEEYYTAIPAQIAKYGIEWLAKWSVAWEWVPLSEIRDALRYGPIQVTVKAWPKPLANGMYDEGGTSKRNHAVMLLRATSEFYEIFDHYDRTRKKLIPTYKFGSALQFSLLKNAPSPMPTVVIANDTLVQETEQSGTFGLYLNGKIFVDDTAKIIASWLMRNGGAVAGKTVALTRAAWDSFAKVDLKNNPL